MLSWQPKISNRIKVYFLPFSLPSAGEQGALFITASQGPCLWKFPQPSVQRERCMDHTLAVNASALKYYMSLLQPCFVGQSRSLQFDSVQSLSCVQFFVIPWTTAHQASLSITNSWSPPKPMSIRLVMPSNHLILCHPLLFPPSICPSIRVFSNESALHIRLPKYWSFSFSIIPSKEHPGLISFRMDWLYLLAVQGTLKSLLQHHTT